MKKALFIFIILISSIKIYSQEDRIYTLREIETAPLIYNYPIIDSLSSKKNFELNLRDYIQRNVGIITGENQANKVYIQFLINKDGTIKILKVKGTSKKAETLGKKVVNRIKHISPAKVNGVDVTMKYTVPIVFYTILFN